jgi:hypothetical protein
MIGCGDVIYREENTCYCLENEDEQRRTTKNVPQLCATWYWLIHPGAENGPYPVPFIDPIDYSGCYGHGLSRSNFFRCPGSEILILHKKNVTFHFMVKCIKRSRCRSSQDPAVDSEDACMARALKFSVCI